MTTSLTAKWKRLLEQAWELEIEVRKVVEQSPKNIISDHNAAKMTACYFSNAIGELRDAIMVYVAEQDSLDQCTEQELVASRPHCQLCGQEITNFDTRSVACDDDTPRHWWHYSCARKERGLSDVHVPTLSPADPG